MFYNDYNDYNDFGVTAARARGYHLLQDAHTFAHSLLRHIVVIILLVLVLTKTASLSLSPPESVTHAHTHHMVFIYFFIRNEAQKNDKDNDYDAMRSHITHQQQLLQRQPAAALVFVFSSTI